MFEARKVAGSATFKVKQHETVLSFNVSLFIQLTQSVETKRVCLFSSFRHKEKKKSNHEDLCLLPIFYLLHL